MTRTLSSLTDWPKPLRSFRRQRAERLHQLADAALLAEHVDARLLDGGKIAGGGNRGEQLPLERLRSVP